jgi:hypothetical protein
MMYNSVLIMFIVAVSTQCVLVSSTGAAYLMHNFQDSFDLDLKNDYWAQASLPFIGIVNSLSLCWVSLASLHVGSRISRAFGVRMFRARELYLVLVGLWSAARLSKPALLSAQFARRTGTALIITALGSVRAQH